LRLNAAKSPIFGWPRFVWVLFLAGPERTFLLKGEKGVNIDVVEPLLLDLIFLTPFFLIFWAAKPVNA
jgi:hypothetical protein